MNKITKKIIEEEFIPKLIKSTKDLLIEALESDDDKNLNTFFIHFEREVNMKREQLKIAEINKN